MEKKIRDLLEKDFPEKMIKKRRGRTGGSIAYVGSPAFIQKLNDGFNGDWSFEIAEWKELHGEAVVLARITGPDGITKEQFGNSTISVYGEKHARAGEVISFGDDLKAAASDALKKCATLFGVGLTVYGGEKAGVQKEEYADPEEVFANVLASIQKGEEELSKKLKCDVTDLRNEHFGADNDVLEAKSLDELGKYLTHLRSLRDAGKPQQPSQGEEKPPPADKPGTSTDDVAQLKSRASQLQAKVLHQDQIPKLDVDAKRMELFGKLSYPEDADLLTQYITWMNEAIGNAGSTSGATE